MRAAWIDATAGIAGDMLLGALVDAGAPLDALQAAVDAVVPAVVGLRTEQVTRAGQRATRVHVELLRADQPQRTWTAIRALLEGAALADRVRARALAVFGRLAEAEARVHGVPAEQVHFHEVGAWDSIADVVGVCAALHALGIDRVTAGQVAVGSGRVTTAHGELPVPAPATAELAVGWLIFAGGPGELATPTGMALVTTLAQACEELPPLHLQTTGVGAGGRDTPGRPNVVRVLVGAPPGAARDTGDPGEALVLEANIDDLDPRLWPGVLTALLAAGAADAWLTPVLMKKGRPAHTLSVLARPDRAAALRAVVFRETTTLGVREHHVHKAALERGWAEVETSGRVGSRLPVKIGHQDGVIVQVTPEFGPAARLAAQRGLPVRAVLASAEQAAAAVGLLPGAPVPADLSPRAPESPQAPGRE